MLKEKEKKSLLAINNTRYEMGYSTGGFTMKQLPNNLKGIPNDFGGTAKWDLDWRRKGEEAGDPSKGCINSKVIPGDLERILRSLRSPPGDTADLRKVRFGGKTIDHEGYSSDNFRCPCVLAGVHLSQTLFWKKHIYATNFGTRVVIIVCHASIKVIHTIRNVNSRNHMFPSSYDSISRILLWPVYINVELYHPSLFQHN